MLAVLGALFVLVAACASSDSHPSEEASATASRTLTSPDAAESLLFVARSDTGSLIVRPSESTLVLDDVDAVTWFADRPDHDAGTSSATDALEALGWTHNGDTLGDDAPNAALIAAELGEDAVIVELLTATIDGERLRFTVDFVSQRPDSTGLSRIELFIDDAVASSDGGRTPTGLEVQETGGIVLGRTVDHLGQPHALMLHLNPAVEGLEESLVRQNGLFAVVSGTTTYSVTGDVAIHDQGELGDWRFEVNSNATGDAAPIVVIKTTSSRSVADLAGSPGQFFAAADLIDDVDGTSARLDTLIDAADSRADTGGPDAALYGALSSALQRPDWTGVLVFNASVSELPSDAAGQSGVALADTRITAVAIGFSGSFGPETTGSFFGVIDHPGDPSDPAAQPDGQHLRAAFRNGALTELSLGSR